MNTLKKMALGLMGQLKARPARGDSTPSLVLPAPAKQGGMPLKELGGLLWAAAGVNRPPLGGRTAPSAMNSQEVDTFVALPSGLYLCDPVAHADYAQRARLGPACGLGAMLGDSAKSLLERRLGIAPGQRWVPADQLDFVLGGLLALAFWVELRWLDVVLVLALSFAATVLVNRIAYAIGVKNVPW